MDSLKVLVIVPTLGRPEKLARLLRLIPETAEYSNYEVVVKQDVFGEGNKGVPRLVAEAVAEAAPDVDAFMYLANDVIPKPGFMRIAVEWLTRYFPDLDGCVGLFDGYWKNSEMFTHFLIGRKLLPALDGEIFHTGYHHIACDCELTERCKKMNKAVWCPDAQVFHDHPVHTGMKDLDPTYQLAYNPERNAEDRELWVKRSKEIGFRIRENFHAPHVPRRIFSIWVGDQPMPPLVERCITSQREFTKGYEFRSIDSSNYPRGIPYVETALAARKWVKAVDYLRLWLLYHEGGIYADADVEFLRPFPDEYLTARLFAGLEWNGWIGNGVVGAEPGHPILKACLERVNREFKGDDDKNFESSVQVLTETTYGMGLDPHGVVLHPPEIFTPYHHQQNTVTTTPDTVAFHHFMVSWGNRERPWERLWRES